MENPKIQPDKITKPIQLLAVWFAGLVILVGLLLSAAKMITEPIWLVPLLVISAILIIPIFLYFVFLLQTKYRPQMQEDTFYSKYLDTTTNETIILSDEQRTNSMVIDLQNQLIQLTESNKIYLSNIETLVKNNNKDSIKLAEIEEYITKSNTNFEQVETNIKKSQFKIFLNRLLPKFKEYRLYLIKNQYENFEEFKGGGEEQLSKSLMSIGTNVEPEFVYELIKLLHPLGLEMISLIVQGHEKDFRRYDVVIGSHSFMNSKRVTLEIDEILIETIGKIKNKEVFHNMFA